MPPPPRREGLPAWVIVLLVLLVVLVIFGILAVVFAFMSGIIVDAPLRPAVTFTPPTPTTDGFQFFIDTVSQLRPAQNFRVVVSVNGTAGVAQTLAASIQLQIGGDAYTFSWTDVGEEGDLNGGDEFRVVRTGGLRASTEHLVRLLWIDGSQVQAATYSTP